MQERQYIKIRLKPELIQAIERLAKVNNLYFREELEKMLEEYLPTEERESYRKIFESAYNTQEFPPPKEDKKNIKDDGIDEIPF